MKANGYINIEAVIHEFRRLTKITTELNKSDILAYAEDALDRIVPADEYVQRIALLPVENYKTELPRDFKTITQVAYRNKCTDLVNPKVIISELTQNILGSDCDLKINLECPSCKSLDICDCRTSVIEVKADRMFEMNNPQLLHNYAKHFYDYGTTHPGTGKMSQYHPDFQLIRRTSSSFFNVPYHISECINLNLDCNIEYSVDLPNIIVNQKDGEILLSYMGVKLDDNGYRLLPNDPTVIKAVINCILERHIYSDYISSGYQQNLRIAHDKQEALMEKWIARARTRLQTPEFDDMYDFITGFIFRVVPKYNYWQDLQRRRPDSFKYPGETYNLRGSLG